MHPAVPGHGPKRGRIHITVFVPFGQMQPNAGVLACLPNVQSVGQGWEGPERVAGGLGAVHADVRTRGMQRGRDISFGK